MLWCDRPERPGTRRYRARLGAALLDEWLGLLGILTIGIALPIIAFLVDPAPRIFLLLTGLAFLLVGLLVVRGMWRDRAYYRRAELHYVLTDKRLIAFNRTDGWRAQIFAGGLAALARPSSNQLELYPLHADEPLALLSLSDPGEAERLISQTLGLSK